MCLDHLRRMSVADIFIRGVCAYARGSQRRWSVLQRARLEAFNHFYCHWLQRHLTINLNKLHSALVHMMIAHWMGVQTVVVWQTCDSSHLVQASLSSFKEGKKNVSERNQLGGDPGQTQNLLQGVDLNPLVVGGEEPVMADIHPWGTGKRLYLSIFTKASFHFHQIKDYLTEGEGLSYFQLKMYIKSLNSCLLSI